MISKPNIKANRDNQNFKPLYSKVRSSLLEKYFYRISFDWLFCIYEANLYHQPPQRYCNTGHYLPQRRLRKWLASDASRQAELTSQWSGCYWSSHKLWISAASLKIYPVENSSGSDITHCRLGLLKAQRVARCSFVCFCIQLQAERGDADIIQQKIESLLGNTSNLILRTTG